jgi:hypothetical protein
MQQQYLINLCLQRNPTKDTRSNSSVGRALPFEPWGSRIAPVLEQTIFIFVVQSGNLQTFFMLVVEIFCSELFHADKILFHSISCWKFISSLFWRAWKNICPVDLEFGGKMVFFHFSISRHQNHFLNNFSCSQVPIFIIHSRNISSLDLLEFLVACLSGTRRFSIFSVQPTQTQQGTIVRPY